MPRKPKNTDAKHEGGTVLSAYLLLDRSGSMKGRMSEAVRSINAYAEELGGSGVSAEVTLCAFDEHGASWNNDGFQFNVVRRRVNAMVWNPVSLDEVSPRGGTPLYDAIDRIVMAAEIEGAERTVIAIMTDGYENASRRISREQAKKLLDKCRARGWQVIFMGADFDAFDQAGSLGNHVGQTINFAQHNYVPAMRGLAGSSAIYTSTGANIAFSEKDRAVASGKTR